MFRKIINTLAIVIILFATIMPHVEVSADTSSISPEMRKLVTQFIPAPWESRKYPGKDFNPTREAFLQGVVNVSSKIGGDPNDLLSAMYLETNITTKGVGRRAFDPTVQNSDTCVGLIQFCNMRGFNNTPINTLRWVSDNDTSGHCTLDAINNTGDEDLRVHQLDCVATFFRLNRLKSPDFASFYVTINVPKGKNYGPHVCLPNYEAGALYYNKNPKFTPFAEVINGTTCVTKTSMASALRAELNNVGIAYFPQQAVDTGDNTPIPDTELYPGWEAHTYTAEEIATADAALNNIQYGSIKQALDQTTAIPAGLFNGCQIYLSNDSVTPNITGTKNLIACIKSVINYVFIIAVITVLISVAAKNLGVVLNSGEGDGTNPVAGARNTLEKGIIGLLLIGAPYLFLDLFTTSGAINLDPLPVVPDFQQVSLKPNYLLDLPKNDFTGEITAKAIADLQYGQDPEQPIDTVNGVAGTGGRGNAPSVLPSACKNQLTCKVLDIAYINQMVGDDGKYNPAGGTACGATTAVMLANYLDTSSFDLSSGSNPNSLSLRDNVFTANQKLKNLKASNNPSSICNMTQSASGTGKSPVDGAWSITADPSAIQNLGGGQVRCFLNVGSGITRYLNLYGIGLNRLQYGNINSLYNDVKGSIDSQKPVLIYLNQTGTRFGGKPKSVGHVLLIKGYTSTPGIYVVNDPWGDGDRSSTPGQSGNGAILDLRSVGANDSVTKGIQVAYSVAKVK